MSIATIRFAGLTEATMALPNLIALARHDAGDDNDYLVMGEVRAEGAHYIVEIFEVSKSTLHGSFSEAAYSVDDWLCDMELKRVAAGLPRYSDVVVTIQETVAEHYLAVVTANGQEYPVYDGAAYEL